jgi:hypothetical protein
MITPIEFDVPCEAAPARALDAVAQHLIGQGYEESARTVDSITMRFTGKLLTVHLDQARHQTKIIATGHNLHVFVTWPWWQAGLVDAGDRARLVAEAEGAARAAAAAAR